MKVSELIEKLVFIRDERDLGTCEVKYMDYCPASYSSLIEIDAVITAYPDDPHTPVVVLR